MSKVKDAWGAIVEAVSILQMTATYTQSKNIPEEQYYRFREIVKTVAENESLPSGVRAAADSLYEICPHGESKPPNCNDCNAEAFEYL